MWGLLQFIRFVRVAMLEIERRADVSHDSQIADYRFRNDLALP